jgi:hypothetical protein
VELLSARGMYYRPLDQAWLWLHSQGSRARRPATFVAVVGIGLFPLLGAGRIFEIPDKDAWAAGSPLAWALIVTGIMSVTAGAVNAARLARSSRSSTLAEACVQLAAYIDEKCPSVALRDVGIHVWRVGGPFFARRLYREQQFLLRQRQSSHVSFTKGKGLIGRVWERRLPEARDLESDFAAVTSQEAFQKLPADTRLNLSWEEVSRLAPQRKCTAPSRSVSAACLAMPCRRVAMGTSKAAGRKPTLE